MDPEHALTDRDDGNDRRRSPYRSPAHQFLLRRDWCRATGWLAFGTAASLNLITEGTHSSRENLVKDAATATLIVIFVIAAVVHQRRARSMPDRPAGQQ